MTQQKSYYPTLRSITLAQLNLNTIVETTPLQRNTNLSNRYSANVFLKREDLQVVRSYKIRGAYNKISGLTDEERLRGVVCASAGNHAQGVAYSCQLLDIKGKIYMPTTTPKQKITQVKMFGKDKVEVILVGDTYDAASDAAHRNSEETGMVYIHPFDDPQIIEGQATSGVEILAGFFREHRLPVSAHWRRRFGCRGRSVLQANQPGYQNHWGRTCRGAFDENEHRKG